MSRFVLLMLLGTALSACTYETAAPVDAVHVRDHEGAY